jgi:hypothetical protein
MATELDRLAARCELPIGSEQERVVREVVLPCLRALLATTTT